MNKPALFLGIDIGTQSIKASIVNADGITLATSSVPSKLVIEKDGTAYESPNDIFDGVVEAIKTIVSSPNVEAKNIVSMGIDSQMAGIMAIDSDFNPVGPYDSWLDTRCEKYSQLIESKFGDQLIQSSGSQSMPSASSKILWRKYERPEEYIRIAKFIQPNGYVTGKLVGLSSKEAFMDSTFLHFNCFSDNLNLGFNKKALSAFEIDYSKMPRIVKPSDIIGKITEEWAVSLQIPDTTILIAGCGDTAASSLGAGIIEEGLAYDVAGTASVFAYATKNFVPDLPNHTLLYSRSVIEGLYLPLAYVAGGGLCLEWFSKLVNTSLDDLTTLASQVDDKNVSDLFFIPHFSGRAFPLDNDIHGAFIGLNNSVGKGEMFKAILESIAFEYRTYYVALKSLGVVDKFDNIHGVGGGAKNNLFCQIKADVLGCDYSALKNVNSAPVAVALLSGRSAGYIRKPVDAVFKKDERDMEIYKCDPSKKAYYDEKFAKYVKIVNSYSSLLK